MNVCLVNKSYTCVKELPKMSVGTDLPFRNPFYFWNKLYIWKIEFFTKLGGSFHLAGCSIPRSSVVQLLAQVFKVSCSVAWQKKMCKMLVFNKCCLVSSNVFRENTEFNEETIEKHQDISYKNPLNSQGAHLCVRTQHDIFSPLFSPPLNRGDFSVLSSFAARAHIHHSFSSYFFYSN